LNTELNWTILIILGIAHIPLYQILGRLFFDGWEGFLQAVGYWFKPDMWSWLSGEGFEDWAAEFKLGVFLACCTGLVYGEYYCVSKWFLGNTGESLESWVPTMWSYLA